jgi:hypothetical protein
MYDLFRENQFMNVWTNDIQATIHMNHVQHKESH